MRTVRPMQTFVGMGAPDPGLPPPPAGMSLPPAGADRRPSQSALRSVPSAGIDPAVYEAIVRLSREVVERVVWEVVPDLAEQIIREQLDRLVEKRGR